MIPPFNEQGYLPQGIYEPTWDEFWERFSTNNYRRQLLTGLRLALTQLKLAGCQRVYIGGSFITDKERPNDYDGCFDLFGIDANTIVGYEFARSEIDIELTPVEARFHQEFQPWLQQKLEVKTTASWAKLILLSERDESSGFTSFYRFLAEFRQEEHISNIELSSNLVH